MLYELAFFGGAMMCLKLGPHHLKRSHLKDTLWSLREFMVVQDHLIDIVFPIRDGPLFDNELGFDRVQHEQSPFHDTDK